MAGSVLTTLVVAGALAGISSGCDGSDSASADLASPQINDLSSPPDSDFADVASNLDGAASIDAAITAGNTITGILLAADGTALPGFKVDIAGAATTSGADGTFTLANVTTPYTLLVGGTVPGGYANPGATHLMKYIGLTRHDPTVAFHMLMRVPPGPRTVTLAGSVTASAIDPSASVTVYSTLGTIEIGVSPTSPMTYSNAMLSWLGTTTIDQTFHAFARVGTSYTHFGELAYPLTDGGSYNVPAIAMASVPSAKMTAVASARPGSTMFVLDEYFAKGELPEPIASLSGGASFSVDEPVVTGSLIYRHFYDENGTIPGTSHLISRGSAGQALGAISLAAPSVAIAIGGAPVNVARNADFALMPGQIGAVHVMYFTEIGSKNSWSVVYTGEHVGFPDGTTVGAANPGTSVIMNYRFYDFEDAGVDATATPGAFTRIDPQRGTLPAFHFSTTNLGGLAFNP